MKKALDILKKAGKFLLNNPDFLMICIIAILVFMQIQSCNDNKNLKKQNEFDKQMADQNYHAVVDQIKVEVSKLGDSVYSKNTLMLNKIKDLKEYNASLYNELKSVKGTILSAINSIVVGGIDSVTVANSLVKYGNGDYGLKFENHYADSGFVNDILGESRFNLTGTFISPGNTTISKNAVELKLTYGIRDLKDRTEIFAISHSPCIRITELNGAYIMPKQVTTPPKVRKWSIGPSVIYGFQPLTGKLSVTFGAGVTYGIIRF